MKLVFFLFVYAHTALSNDLVFKRNGIIVRQLSISKSQNNQLKLTDSDISTMSLKVFNIFRGYERTYLGYDFFKLLTFVYGASWKNKTRLIFTSIDGYHQTTLISPMLINTKDKFALLAFSDANLKGFTLIGKGTKKIDPGPLYLVWGGYSLNSKGSHGDNLKWPYQLETIEIE